VPTEILVNAIEKSKEPPKVFLCGSAIGYYPKNTPFELTETYSGPPADNFSGKLCSEWEKTAGSLKKEGVKKAIIRTGIVLGHGGALQQMLLPFKVCLSRILC
jgi:NAD dependent epimerase/dehydratase family enzyme